MSPDMPEHLEKLDTDRQPGPKTARRIRTNSVLALSAMFLSAVSAAAVIWQVKITADQRAAAVWPHIRVFPSRSSSPPLFAINMVNSGVGPAIVRYFAVKVDGKPVRSWREFLSGVSSAEAVRRAPFDEGVVRGSGWVMAPQVPVIAFAVRETEAVTVLAAPAWSRIAVSFCYCSIFNDCWLSEWDVAMRDDPAPVRACPTADKFGVDWSELDAAPATP
jgi:hypothetical protein